jgi:hypothetical protein
MRPLSRATGRGCREGPSICPEWIVDRNTLVVRNPAWSLVASGQSSASSVQSVRRMDRDRSARAKHDLQIPSCKQRELFAILLEKAHYRPTVMRDVAAAGSLASRYEGCLTNRSLTNWGLTNRRFANWSLADLSLLVDGLCTR